MTRTPSNRVGSLISRRWPSPRTAVLAALPGHTEGLGDTRHRHMMNDHARQRPAHRRTRELRARIGRLAHILAPPVRLVRQAPDHRVTRLALASAASTPPVLTSNPASQHCMVWPHALARHFQAQVIQARERAQVRAIKDSIGHVEVFQMDGVGTPIIGRPRPLPSHDTPNPAHNTYTLKCEEPQNPRILGLPHTRIRVPATPRHRHARARARSARRPHLRRRRRHPHLPHLLVLRRPRRHTRRGHSAGRCGVVPVSVVRAYSRERMSNENGPNFSSSASMSLSSSSLVSDLWVILSS